MSALSAGHTKTLLHLCPHKTTVIHKLYHAVHEAGLKFMKWCLYGVHDGEIDPKPDLFLAMTLGFISVHVSCHSSGHWIVGSRQGMSLRDVKVGSHRHVTRSDTIF